MGWKERLKRWIVPRPVAVAAVPQIEPGLYHFQREREGGYLRLYLRVDPGGGGLLIASAAEIVPLSTAGVIAAKGLLDGKTAAVVAAQLPTADSGSVVATVADLLEDLGRPSGRYPILNPTDPALSTDTAGMLAPFRADLEAGGADAMRRQLARLWEVGVPHARLIAREGIEIESLVLAVERAEDLGMITGLTADCRQLSAADGLDRLAAVGLDYVVVPWGVTDPLHHKIYGPTAEGTISDLLRRIHGLEMTPVLEIPLVDETDDVLEENTDQLGRWNVTNVEVFAVVEPSGDVPPEGRGHDGDLRAYAPHELPQAAAWAEDLADQANLRLVWLPPLVRSADETVAAAIRRGVRAGGEATVRVTAGGDVIPPRGPYAVAGNLLADDWPVIWQHATFQRLREDVEQVAAEPSDPRGWQQPRP